MSVVFGFEHTFAEQLSNSYVAHAPQGFPAPELLAFNAPLFEALGLPEAVKAQAATLCSGTVLASDARPVAQAYAGHQFGGFSPQLGDGRALLLGEVVDPAGARFDIQLKGSGPTPFSRGGDGKATVGPILREYLVAEAMYALGVPTSRVLAAVKTGETIRRDGLLPGAVLARVAASHLRVGSLQYLAARQQTGALEDLVNYALKRHFPHRVGQGLPAVALLQSVAEAQAKLIAKWMSVGFVHGVMNTDNSTLSGETIDYGPCAFMDRYDPATVFSSIDRGGRYAYRNQPAIGRWNLARLAEAMLSLLGETEEAAIEQAHKAIEIYGEAYQASIEDQMRLKLGVLEAGEDDAQLISDLLAWMQAERLDFTQTFRSLSDSLEAPAYCGDTFGAWHRRWRARHGDEPVAQIAARMNRHNPIYIPRNHLVEEALEDAVDGDMAPFEALLAVVRAPFDPQPDAARFAEPAPDGFGPYRTFCGT